MTAAIQVSAKKASGEIYVVGGDDYAQFFANLAAVLVAALGVYLLTHVRFGGQELTIGRHELVEMLGTDFFLAFSPEREDPGNATHSVHNIPKVVGGCTPAFSRMLLR